jgi:hypothetical protein
MTDLHALVAPYALDAVDDLDRRRFDAHLPECEMCTAQVAGFAATAAVLAGSEAKAPPTHLRSQILSTIAVVPQNRTFSQNPRRTWRRLLPALVVAAALVVPAAGAAEFVTDQLNSADANAASASVSSVLASPDAATRSKSVAGGGSVRVVSSRARGAAIVAADRLPALADGKTYQVWTLATGDATSRGTFKSSTVVTANRLGSADRVAVTVEPDGGSVRPTSLPIAVLPL